MKKYLLIALVSFCVLFSVGAIAADVKTITQETAKMAIMGPVGYAAVQGVSAAASIFVKILMEFMGSTSTSFCWFCPIYETMFNAIDKLVTYSVSHLSAVFLALMAVGLLFSIAFKVGKVVTQLQAVDVMQFLTDMFKHLGRAMIASALLLFSFSIFAVVINPFLIMSMTIGQDIVTQIGMGGGITTATQESGAKTMPLCADLDVAAKVKQEVAAPVENADGSVSGGQQTAFSDGVKAAFQCMLRSMSASLVFGMVVSACFVFMGWAQISKGWLPLPDFYLIILGYAMLLGYFLIYVAFPFKLIDAMVRLAFVCALAPLWIILWVFPATVGYTKKAWDMFLSTCLIFICLSVIMALIMLLLQAAIPNRETLIADLVAGRVKEAADRIPLSGSAFLVTMAMSFMGFKMLGMATTLASSFIGAIPNLGIGDTMSKASVSMAKAAAPYAAVAGRKAMDKMGIDQNKRGKIAKWGTRGGLAVATGGWSVVAEGAYRGIGALWNGKKASSVRQFQPGGGTPDGSNPNTGNQGPTPNNIPPFDPNNPRGQGPDGKNGNDRLPPVDPNNPREQGQDGKGVDDRKQPVQGLPMPNEGKEGPHGTPDTPDKAQQNEGKGPDKVVPDDKKPNPKGEGNKPIDPNKAPETGKEKGADGKNADNPDVIKDKKPGENNVKADENAKRTDEGNKPTPTPSQPDTQGKQPDKAPTTPPDVPKPVEMPKQSVQMPQPVQAPTVTPNMPKPVEMPTPVQAPTVTPGITNTGSNGGESVFGGAGRGSTSKAESLAKEAASTAKGAERQAGSAMTAAQSALNKTPTEDKDKNKR